MSEKLDVKSLKSVFSQSSFVLPDREDHWVKAIQCFVTGEYHKCLLLLFPLLEHAIRVIYVCINDCENRVLTAGNSYCPLTFFQRRMFCIQLWTFS